MGVGVNDLVKTSQIVKLDLFTLKADGKNETLGGKLFFCLLAMKTSLLAGSGGG